ncbi:uncharacterized protein LJ206_002580 isoform 2-T2 [Theristicus caerulescens]
MGCYWKLGKHIRELPEQECLSASLHRRHSGSPSDLPSVSVVPIIICVMAAPRRMPLCARHCSSVSGTAEGAQWRQHIKGGLGQADPSSHELDGHPTATYGSPWLHIPAV